MCDTLVMVESVVQLQGNGFSLLSATAGDQATSGPVAERRSPRLPAPIYLPWREIESQDSSFQIGIRHSSNARPSLHDPEKEPFEWHSHPSLNLPCNNSRVTYADYEDGGDDDGPKEHAVWILIYLSALSPLLALPIALYTLLMGTLLLLLFPLCFCLKQLPMCARFRHFLSPLLVLQLRLVYSSYDICDPTHSETSGIVVLVLISMLSPLYAVAIAAATWVAGIFWFYTAILGNPDGKEDRDDGREAVLAVRRWWERWLIQSLGPEDHSTLRENGSGSCC